MKKIHTLLSAAIAICLYGCGGSGEKNSQEQSADNTAEQTDSAVSVMPADARARVFVTDGIDKAKAFAVISKKTLSLSVYAGQKGDTVLVARYPVCISKNKGQKTESGDMRTPETEADAPFTITEIKDASTWSHDFGDGRGSILAYGHWFMRLSYGHGIGIHGSTNNRWSVPGSNEAVPEGKTLGRDSEGCIRLLDEDIIHFHDNYATLGMNVYIKHEDQGLLDFEKRVKNIRAEGRLIADTPDTTAPTTTGSNNKYTSGKSND
ncbi:MAG: L,D-transpeptidase [Bacteroidaceae bacterium]|nr:L,D-transpeptidase [Bacteroidaceae bacterium]